MMEITEHEAVRVADIFACTSCVYFYLERGECHHSDALMFPASISYVQGTAKGNFRKAEAMRRRKPSEGGCGYDAILGRKAGDPS